MKNKNNKPTQYELVKNVLLEAKSPVTLYYIVRSIYQNTGRMVSDAAASARIRDIRRDLETTQGLTIACRKRCGLGSFEYWVEKSEKGTAA